jgi:hypothetical protein
MRRGRRPRTRGSVKCVYWSIAKVLMREILPASKSSEFFKLCPDD